MNILNKENNKKRVIITVFLAVIMFALFAVCTPKIYRSEINKNHKEIQEQIVEALTIPHLLKNKDTGDVYVESTSGHMYISKNTMPLIDTYNNCRNFYAEQNIDRVTFITNFYTDSDADFVIVILTSLLATAAFILSVFVLDFCVVCILEKKQKKKDLKQAMDCFLDAKNEADNEKHL